MCVSIPSSPAVIALERLRHSYILTNTLLGFGRISLVLRARSRKTMRQVAVKMIDKTTMTELDLEQLEKEIKILMFLREHPHKNIINMLDFYEDEEFCFLVFEYYSMDLLHYIDSKDCSEHQLKSVMRQILAGLQHLHSHDLVHRDLKPENILINKDTGHVVLTDFGYADFCRYSSKLDLICGTFQYMAPEILEGNSYCKQVDIWSLGVLMFVLYAKRFPFNGNTQAQYERNAKNGLFSFLKPKEAQISKQGCSLLRDLLSATDPVKRPSLVHVCMHGYWKE